MYEHPVLIPANDSEYYLVDDYTYQWTSPVKHSVTQRIDQMRVIVPKGFVTDIASVPRIAWSLSGILPDGLHRGAAVVHDYLYQHRGRPPHGQLQRYTINGWKPSTVNLSRRDVDKLFAQAMTDAGVSGVKKNLMYWAVRMFGAKAWNT